MNSIRLTDPQGDLTVTTADSPRSSYKRVMLKLGGEMFGGGNVGIDPDVVENVARQIAEVARTGAEIAVVIGGGNFFRGAQLQQRGMDRARSDYMGMLGTVMNAIALADALRARGVASAAMSAIPMPTVCQPYSRREAIENLDAGKVVIFAGGTGSPFFSTDMCAALRAAEIDAEVVMKATKVDGVYDRDPVKDPSAVKYERLTYAKVLQDGLGVMDLTAITMCMETRLPIMVFQFDKPGQLRKALAGEHVGTIISGQ